MFAITPKKAVVWMLGKRQGGRAWTHLVAWTAPLAVLCGGSVVSACAVDNIPSLRVDGVLPIVNITIPTKSNARTWAPFVIKQPVVHARVLSFTEDRASLAQSLPPEIVDGRWTWRFGDGASARGRSTRHRYARPGLYLLTVAMPLPHAPPFIFDAVTINVR